MAIDLESAPTPTVTALVTGIIADGQSLFKQQADMLAREIKADLRRTREAGLLLILGASVGLVGAILLAMMLVLLTQWAMPQWPLWACCGTWGLVMLVAGSGLFCLGKLRLDSFNPLKDESAQSVKENMSWTTNPK